MLGNLVFFFQHRDGYYFLLLKAVPETLRTQEQASGRTALNL